MVSDTVPSLSANVVTIVRSVAKSGGVWVEQFLASPIDLDDVAFPRESGRRSRSEMGPHFVPVVAQAAAHTNRHVDDVAPAAA